MLNLTLTEKEKYVLDKLSCGISGQDIAAELGIKYQVFKNKMVRLRNRMGADNTIHAVAIALREGYIK